MVDKTTREQALEILANPNSKEKEWAGALAILGGKVTRPNRRFGFKLKRFCTRVIGVLLIQNAVFYVFSLLTGLPWSFQVFQNLIMWSFFEVAFGGFTALAGLTFATHIPDLFTMSPLYHLTWIVVLVNLLIYRAYNFMPYALVPLKHIKTSAKRISQRT